MKFRPCIDIHNGKVKQLVGGTLKDKGNKAQENFVSQKDGAYYANMYKNNNLEGGHIIILNAADSEYFEASKKQALEALAAYPELMQKMQLNILKMEQVMLLLHHMYSKMEK